MFSLSSLRPKLSLIILLAATPCLGGENQWTRRQPSAETGQILGLAVDPQDPGTIFLASQNGFFRSEDSGRDWDVVNSNPFGRQVIPHLAPPLTALFALGGNGVLFSLTALFGTMTVESDQPVAAVALRQNEDILDTFPSSVPTLTVFPVIADRADQASN